MIFWYCSLLYTGLYRFYMLKESGVIQFYSVTIMETTVARVSQQCKLADMSPKIHIFASHCV